MFETETTRSPGQYGQSRRRGGQDDGQGEYGYGEAEYGEAEYGEAEYGGQSEYGQGEAEYGGQSEYGQGEAAEYGGQSEYGQGEYGYGEAEYGGQSEYGQGEAEYGGQSEAASTGELGQTEAEEQFLPLAGLIPVAGQLLGGLLGRLGSRQREAELNESEGEEEAGEAEEQFLGRILRRVFAGELESGEILSPSQEAELAAEFLELTSEQELDHFLGGIINTVGKVVQGVANAARSPQGRAVINAVKPLARQVLPALGGALGGAIVPGVGSQVGRTLGSMAGQLFETEAMGLSQEQEHYEVARRIVRLTAGAARDVAQAPPGTPPRLAGELAVVHESRRYARPVYRSALRRIRPLSRRFWGRRYGSFRSSPYRRAYRGTNYGRPGYRQAWRGYRRPYRTRVYGYGVPTLNYPPAAEPPPEATPEPPPAAPGYRWVAVPIGASASMPDAPAPSTTEPPAATSSGDQSEMGMNREPGHAGGSTGPGGRWVRRGSKIILLGV